VAVRGTRTSPKQPAADSVVRIGDSGNAGRFIGALREGLEELGYVEGRNIELIGRYAENKIERLPSLAQEVVALKPAEIVAGASDAALAAKKVTSTIPIVSGTLVDA